MKRLLTLRRLLAAGVLGWGLQAPVQAQLALPAAPQMQRLPAPGAAEAMRRTAPDAATAQGVPVTVQSQIDHQRQINERIGQALATLSGNLQKFRQTPQWDDRRDYCLGPLYSFDRVTGNVYACEGTRCFSTGQNNRSQDNTCDPARRGPPLCNTSDWCQPGYACQTSPAPGVCIRTDCPADMGRDDCQPRIDRVHRGAWK